MLLNSIEFILFFPLGCLIYFLLPGIKSRNTWLLVASYYFYMCWEPVYALLLLTSAGIAYLSALYIERLEQPKHKKWTLVIGLLINIGRAPKSPSPSMAISNSCECYSRSVTIGITH